MYPLILPSINLFVQQYCSSFNSKYRFNSWYFPWPQKAPFLCSCDHNF